MIYGKPYEAATRNCTACGELSNVHTSCTACKKAICDSCGLYGSGDDFCSEACLQAVCTHAHVRYECADDCDRSAGYSGLRESWTCRDCGAELEGDEEVIYTERRAA